MRADLFLTSLFALALAACSREPPPSSGHPVGTVPLEISVERPRDDVGDGRQATAADVRPLDERKFGAAITEPMTTPLEKLVKDPSQFANKTIRTEGVVSAVCQPLGCWIQILEQSQRAHVTMAKSSFFMPKESVGHRAVLQGKVLPGDPPKECSRGEGCARPDAAVRVSIEATGVELID